MSHLRSLAIAKNDKPISQIHQIPPLSPPNQSITKIFFIQALENQKIVPTFAVLKIRIKL
jgi:hypothetical protein